MQPLVSVIIPVYKVEPYLARCVRSVCTQTYEHLEVILVDDGSPDRCGAMCDSFASKDERIRVIHQSNMGLSGARNAGIESCTGEYVLFVDSDDWIEHDMVAVMIDSALRNNADVCCCGHYDHSYRKDELCRTHNEEQVFKGEDILTANANETIINTAWGKLWRQSVFDGGMRFPLGRNYEDIATTWQLLAVCETAVYVPAELYHYAPGNNSITRIWDLSNLNDFWTAHMERFQALGQTEKWRCNIERSCLSAAGYVWMWYYSAAKEARKKGPADQCGEELLEQVHRFSLEHADCIKKREHSLKIRIPLLFACHKSKCSLLACNLLNHTYRIIKRAI